MNNIPLVWKGIKSHKGISLIIIFVTVVSGYLVVDKAVFMLERNNRFCIACHLHEKKYEDFTAHEARIKSLSARHHSAKEIRCIDCHKGEGVYERIKVLTIAGVDTVVYLLGMHNEPEEMNFPLSDATCIKCHREDLVPKGSYSNNYHDLTPHSDLPIRCAECHIAHITGNKRFHYLVEEKVIPICKRCHIRMFD